MVNSLYKLWWKLVQFGFHLLYHQLAFTYDVVSYVVSLGKWREWQRTVLQFMPSDPSTGMILDLAHGTGNLHLDLVQRGYQTVGVDLSPQMGRITRGKLKRSDYSPMLVRGSAMQLPLGDRSFVCIVATFPTNFIIEPQTLREINRVLISGGQAVIVLNGTLKQAGFIGSIIEWAYAITGQTGNDELDNSVLDYFKGYGLVPALHIVPCEKSEATVVTLTKPEDFHKLD